MTLPYWDYFLSIESDLIASSRYVEFSKENFSTFSIEFARIIMAACSEIDTVMKETCKKIDPSKPRENINNYFEIIIPRFPAFTKSVVEIPKYELSFTPWENLTRGKGPEWWKEGYNAIKHDRTHSFSKANLKNAFLSVAALLVGILYFYEAAYKQKKPLIDAFNAPKLFKIRGAKKEMYISGDYLWVYELL